MSALRASVLDTRRRGKGSKGSIGFKHQRDGLLQVDPGLLKGCALRVRARKLLNECDVTLRDSAENRSELKIHGSMIPRLRRPVASAFELKDWALVCQPPGHMKPPTPPKEGGMGHPREDFAEMKERGVGHPPD